MSRAKELKTNPENSVNMYNLFSMFSPNEKSKYVDLLLRLLKKTPGLDSHRKEIDEYLFIEHNIEKEKLKEFTDLEIVFFYRIIENMFNSNDLKSFRKFCDYNERGLIRQNDLSKYNTFEELLNSLSIAETIVETKTMEKQVRIVFENDEWLMIRPLTFQASKKYGSNTKWCTTQENNPDYFMKYSKRGVLIYTINKKSGYKVAAFHSLDKNEPEFSFWSQKDTRIDSMETELTSNLLDMIKRECTINAKTNRFLLSDDERIKEEKLLGLKSNREEEVLAEEPIRAERRARRIGRVLETNEEDITQEILEQPEPPISQEVQEEATGLRGFISSSFRA